jgi:DNA-binding beta-propeller fold protein YncE
MAGRVGKQAAPVQMCPEHKEEMKVYCFDCSCLVCLYCTVKGHNGHNHDFIENAAPKLREDLLGQLEPLKVMKVRMLLVMKEIEDTKSEVEAQVGTVSAQIQSSFDELQQVLDNRRQELIKNAKSKGVEKLKHLSDQEKKLSESCAAVQSVVESTEQSVGGDEIICVHAEIQSTIKREIAEKKYDILYAIEEADIGVEVDCAEDLKQLCQRKAKLTQLIGVTVSGEGLESAEVNKMSEFNITANVGDGQHMKRKLYIECFVKSLLSGSIIECEFQTSKHCVQYTPTVRGRHMITVKTSGSEIPGSPFPVLAAMNPTQLVKPVRVIDGIEPLHAAVNSAGETVVTDPQNITIFNTEGERVISVKFKEEVGVNPFGLAIDSDDFIYVPCRLNGSILVKLSPALKLIHRSIKFDAEFWNMSIVEDKLMVCNGKDNGVMVFNKDLELVREIDIAAKVGGGLKNIRSFSSDNRGNLYFCGGESSIHVFDINGEFLHAFGGKKLTSTRGICVAGAYVYVTDYATNDVLTYSTEGQYIASFKQNNNCSFNRPWGMCSDKDGFIYVCDRENKRVLIF